MGMWYGTLTLIVMTGRIKKFHQPICIEAWVQERYQFKWEDLNYASDALLHKYEVQKGCVWASTVIKFPSEMLSPDFSAICKNRYCQETVL